jgi:hypothetical protein
MLHSAVVGDEQEAASVQELQLARQVVLPLHSLLQQALWHDESPLHFDPQQLPGHAAIQLL